jgi:outer membrane receptor protein involved in Fe transport
MNGKSLSAKIKSMKKSAGKLYLLLGLAFAVQFSAIAQTDCSDALGSADDKYQIGRFSEAVGILQPCLQSFATEDEKKAAYKLMARIYIGMDDFEKAKENVNQLLAIDPEYSVNRSEETQTFADMVAEAQKNIKRNHTSDIIITTASKRSQLASDAPATIYVRTREQILLRGYTNLMELLQDIPEAEIQMNSISEFRNQYTLRGIAGVEKFVVMVDGVRITPSTGDPYSLGTNFSLVNAARVEVILGPASALYGADAFSGIINIITINPADLQGAVVSSGYGQYNTFENSVVAGKKINDAGFTVAAHHYASEEPDYYNIYPDDFSWYNNQYKPTGQVMAGNELITVTPDAADRDFEMPVRSYFINGKVNYGNFEIGMTRHRERHSSSVSVDPAASLYTKNAFIAATSQTTYARHIFEGRNKKWSIMSLLTMNRYSMDPESRFINKFTSFDEGYKYQFSKSEKIEEQFEYQFSRSTILIAGCSFEDLTELPKTADLPSEFNTKVPANYQNFQYANTDTTDYLGRSLKTYQDFYYLDYQNIGGYFQLSTKVVRKLEATLGGRYDYNTRFGSHFSPRFGIVARPVEKIRIKLLYGRAFLAPSPWKAYSTYGSFSLVKDDDGNVTGLQSPFFHIPNPDLKPEKLGALEGSIAYYLKKDLSFSLNTYYNHISNLINIQEGVGSGTYKDIPVSYVEMAVNNGEADMYGGTVSGNYMFSAGKKNFSLNAAYTLSDGNIDGAELSLSAKHTFRATADFTMGRFSLSLRSVNRSRSNSVIRNNSGDYYSNPAFSILNTYVRFEVFNRKKYTGSVYLKINNLTNNKYYNAAAGQDSFPITPQDPIRAQLGIFLTVK